MIKIINILNSKPKLKQLISIFIVMLGMCLVFTLSSKYFLTVDNVLTVALQSSIIAVIAIGQTLVLITGGIDLSVGATIGLSGVCVSIFMVNGIPVILACIFAIMIGSLVGAINGGLIVYGKLPPFVVTLGSMSITRGLALLITNGIPVSKLPKAFAFIGNGTLFMVPVPVYIMITLTIIFHFMLTKTSLGLHIYSTGSNIQASKLAGVNTKKVIILVYLFSGMLAAIAGIIFASRVISGQPTAGASYELYSVASSVIGGTSLSGGEGIVSGTLIGALIIGILRNGLNLVGVSAFLQEVLIGVVIITAVFLDRIKEKSGN